MSDLTESQRPALATPSVGKFLRAGAAAWLMRPWASLRAWRRCSSDIRHLHRCDDRMLTDLGLRRDGTEGAIRHGATTA